MKTMELNEKRICDECFKKEKNINNINDENNINNIQMNLNQQNLENNQIENKILSSDN